MELRAFFLCEQVVRRLDQSIDVLRFGIENINLTAASAPAELGIGLVCRLRFSPVESGSHEVKFTQMDEDGAILSERVLQVLAQDGKSTDWSFGGPFPIRAEKSGRHVVILTVDRNEIARWPLSVNLRIQAPAGPEN